MNRYLWLVVAFSIQVIGMLAGRLFGLSLAATMTLSTVPAFLAVFPFVKRGNPKTSFGFWLLAAVISAVAGWVLYLGSLRVGG
jgi:hypothetical protein